MINKRLIIKLCLVLFCSCMLLFAIFVYNEDEKLMSFIWAYRNFNKHLSTVTDNYNHNCMFKNKKFSNNIEMSCKILRDMCIKDIPTGEEINSNTACAIVTVDINGFGTGQDALSSNEKLSDQYQMYLYRNGVVINPDSIEYKLSNKRRRLPRNIMRLFIYNNLSK